MWDPIIKNMQSKSERERLEQAEDEVRAQKKAIAELEKRIEKLEEKLDGKQKTTHYYWASSSGNGVFVR